MANFRVLFLALLLLASPFLQGGWCQSDSDSSATEVADAGENVGEVGEESQDVFGLELSPAPGVETICVFPKNSAKLVTAGEKCELLVGMKNDGQSSIDIVGVKGTLHLPLDHQLLVQNLTGLSFNNASVPTSAQATFPYIFAVSKFLQPGPFDLVGTVIYEIDGKPYQSTFYNGTIEVIESGNYISMETFLLGSFGVIIIVLLLLNIRGQLQQRFAKKTKKTAKVEVGTATKDVSLDEWLEGTAYTQSSSKSKKKK